MKDIKILFIDIETGTAPDAELFKPDFKEPRKNKDGTYNKTDKSLEEQETVWKSKLALSPLTGQVLMIGFNCYGEEIVNFQCNNEVEEITEPGLLLTASEHLHHADLIIGHYIKTFDLPFIINRCRKHGITRPEIGMIARGSWKWDEKIIDLADLWQLGNKYDKDGKRDYIALNTMAKYFGLKEKDCEIGKNFQEIFETDLNKAISYCKHDIELTKQIYERLR